MALPTTGITTTLVKNTLGAGSNDVGQLCIHPNVNKWSKRKPFRDNVIHHNEAYWWRRSGISPNIRSGLYIPYGVDQTWSYPKPSGGINSPYRLGDFRGYQHGGESQINIDFPNVFGLEKDYEATFVMTGYINPVTVPDDDVGVLGLQDIFDIENKYVCLGVKLQSQSQTITRYSGRITHIQDAALFGEQVVIPYDDMIQMQGQGGTITMEMFIVEADDYVANQFINPEIFSIRAIDEMTTKHYNNQFVQAGFNVYSNFDTLEPTRSNGVVYSTTYEQIAFNSLFRTGGLISGYYFRARIIGNQIGSNYTYLIPDFTLPPNTSQIVNIPSFTLQMLDPFGECMVEYALFASTEEILKKTWILL